VNEAGTVEQAAKRVGLTREVRVRAKRGPKKVRAWPTDPEGNPVNGKLRGV
jgi:hypothetical protein